MFSVPTSEMMNGDICYMHNIFLDNSRVLSIRKFIHVAFLYTTDSVLLVILFVHPFLISPFKFLLRFCVSLKLQNVAFFTSFLFEFEDIFPTHMCKMCGHL